MRRLLALLSIAMLAMGLSFGVMGCSTSEQTSTPESAPAMDEEMSHPDSMMADTSGMDMSDSGMEHGDDQ